MALLSNFTTTASNTLHLIHPATGLPMYDTDANGNEDKSKPLAIVLHGPGSSQVKAVRAKLMNKSLKRNNKKVTAEQLMEDAVELLAGSSSHALNLELEPGVAINTFDQFKSLYENPDLSWVKEQVDNYLSDQSNFFR